jgi:acyl carrier protein
MTKSEIEVKAKSVLAEEFEVEEDTITPDADIKKTLNLDSLSLVDLVALMEETFNVKIKGTEIIKIKTFTELYDFVLARIEDK